MIHFWPNGLIREAQMSATIAVQDDFEAQELRVFAGRVKDANQARRLLAIAAIWTGWIARRRRASAAWIVRRFATTEPQAPAPDPFNPANLRFSQSFVETAGVKKLLTTVPVRKPSPQDFVRVHSDPAYRENFPIIELKDEREEYIVVVDLVPALIGEFVTKTLFTAINRQGTVFFWPVRLPSPDGKNLDWWRSGREAAELAMKSWIRVRANMNLGAYDIFTRRYNEPSNDLGPS
jgi:hypothetical protein